MEAILEFVKGIVIFTFLTAILEQLISESIMQKYVRFFTGILFCVLLLQGVLTAFKKQDLLKEMEQLSQEYTEDDMDDMFLEQEEEREQKITEEYEKQKIETEQEQLNSKNDSKESSQDRIKIEIPRIIIEGEEDGE